MLSLCFIDVETTGRFADKHDIVQLACIPIVKGVKQKPFNEFCKPKNFDTIEDEAIAVHGISRSKMMTFQNQEDLLDHLVSYLSSFNTRFIIAGFNVGFDKQFISHLFNKNGRSKDFFSLFDINIHDTLSRARSIKNQIHSENMKLETLAKYWNIQIKAHDAISDIEATIEVDNKIGKLLGEQEFTYTEHEKVEVPDFKEMAHLHLHSMYDMVESIPHPKDWKQWCASINSPGYSIVDHCSAVSLSVVNKLNKDSGPRGVPGCGLIVDIDGELCDLNAWAISNEGYFNLNYLASVGYDNHLEIDGVKKSVISMRQLVDNSLGLLFGVGSPNGFLGKLLLKDDKSAVLNMIQSLSSVLKDKLFIELTAIDITHTYSSKLGFQVIGKTKDVRDSNVAKALNNILFDFATENSLNMLAVSAACFIDKSDKLLQDIVAKNSYSSGKCYYEVYDAKPTREIYRILKQHLSDKLSVEAFNTIIDNSIDIVEKSSCIDVSFSYSLPKADIPGHIREKTDDYNKQTYYLLVEKCKHHGRWRDDPIYIDRFKKEVDVILNNKALNFIPYFLLYEDIATFARSKGIMQGIARGSAGGSLISYYLKIIHIDPIAADLPFERFLSHARINAGSLPDIDCLDGDTLISTSSGDKISIRDLSALPVDKYPELLSFSESQFVSQKPLLVFKKGIKEVIEYTFDDGSILVCTKDHKVLTKNNGYVEIQEAMNNGYEIISFK